MCQRSPWLQTPAIDGLIRWWNDESLVVFPTAMCFLLFSLSQVFFSHSGPHCGRNTLPKKGFRYFFIHVRLLITFFFILHSGSPNYLFFRVHIHWSKLLLFNRSAPCTCVVVVAFVLLFGGLWFCPPRTAVTAQTGMMLHQVVTFALESSCFGFCCSQLESIHDHALWSILMPDPHV